MMWRQTTLAMLDIDSEYSYLMTIETIPLVVEWQF
jgi:hypothetical protein